MSVELTSAESAQAVVTDCVAVTAGHPTHEFKFAWILKPDIVDGLRFVDVHVGDYRCQRFLGENIAMVDHIKRLRNRKVEKLMKELAQDDDPNGDNLVHGGQQNRPKRELIDRLPSTIVIEVETRSGIAASVNVLPSWRERGVLQIELTEQNMDLLCEEPPAEPAPWTPCVRQPDVFWVAPRKHVRCNWWDSKRHKMRTKSKLVEFDSDMDNEQKQQVVTSAAAELQEFHEARHNLEDNMPDDSAESAHDELPKRKASRKR